MGPSAHTMCAFMSGVEGDHHKVVNRYVILVHIENRKHCIGIFRRILTKLVEMTY